MTSPLPVAELETLGDLHAHTMESDPEEPEDEPWTAEDEARMQATMREAEIAFEAEATSIYGPPEIRARKNQRYAARLVRRHGEATIRGILKALSTIPDLGCASDLANYDLEARPLSEIIQPFELFGLNFQITDITEPRLNVEIGAAYGRVGSGGTLHPERLPSGSFRVADVLRQWIA